MALLNNDYQYSGKICSLKIIHIDSMHIVGEILNKTKQVCASQIESCGKLRFWLVRLKPRTEICFGICRFWALGPSLGSPSSWGLLCLLSSGLPNSKAHRTPTRQDSTICVLPIFSNLSPPLPRWNLKGKFIHSFLHPSIHLPIQQRTYYVPGILLVLDKKNELNR